MPRRGRVLGFFMPLVAVAALILLLIFALTRLAQIQHDMRSNVSANMLWVITQTQVKALRLESMAQQYLHGAADANDVEHAWRLLLNRFNLLSAGPQRRYLEGLGSDTILIGSIDQTRWAVAGVLEHDGVRASAEVLINTLHTLDAQLSALASRTMVAQWEELGSRLERYRNGVLTIIFLMLGICVCSFIISVYLFIALRRVRESEWAKRQALQLQSELEAERRVGELHRNFAAMVSHQFRTPLAIIDSSMQRILRMRGHVQPDELLRRVHKVRRATVRLARLVEHTRIADEYADVFDVAVEPCDLLPLVEAMVQQQREISPTRLIRVITPQGEAVPPVLCDPMLAEHIIFNFLSNAVKYSPDETTVQVVVNVDDHWVCCSVKDHGRGIHPRDLPRLFERYYRGHGVDDTPGTGIGLYVVAKLAQLQDAMVGVEPNEEGGSVFKICFRRARGTPATQLEDDNAIIGG